MEIHLKVDEVTSIVIFMSTYTDAYAYIPYLILYRVKTFFVVVNITFTWEVDVIIIRFRVFSNYHQAGRLRRLRLPAIHTFLRWQRTRVSSFIKISRPLSTSERYIIFLQNGVDSAVKLAVVSHKKLKSLLN